MARGRLRRRRTPGLHLACPIWRPSTAPLASVWLIGTAMLMGVYVNPTHAVVVDLPAPPPPNYLGVLSPSYNRVTIARDGFIRWNGEQVSDRELSQILSATKTANPQPALLFHPDDDAAYARSLEVMDIIRRQGLIDRCFVFAEVARHRRFEQDPDYGESLPRQQTECAPYYY